LKVLDHPARRGQQTDLAAALEAVRAAIVAHARLDPEEAGAEAPELQPPADAPPAAGEEGSSLQALCRLFDLSPFERDVLVLCAGIELDATFAPLCAKAQVDPQRSYPTFGLALAALSDGDWRALLPESPLRHWQLVRLAEGEPLTTGELRIDERILHFLVGFESRDPRLVGLVDPVVGESELVPSHRRLAALVADAWQRTRGTPELPVVELCGGDVAAKRAVARAACDACGVQLEGMAAETLPVNVEELDELLRLWHREALLSGTVLLLDGDELTPEDPRQASLRRFLDRSRSALLVTRRKRLGRCLRPLLSLDVDKPGSDEQHALWRRAVAAEAPGAELDDPRIEKLVGQFHMSAAEIREAWLQARGRLEGDPDGGLPEALWESCRERARPALTELAQRLEPGAKWEDLVLPEHQLETLREVVVHLRHRATVHRRWGFAEKSARGLGISALFAGASGTGKTMAAEVLAGELDLDLYRIDLAAVISKYIGETEKNLQRVFDAAESGGALLLFDEADALFGKRSEVKDSHDRYANIEVSFLLQRMETYNGLAILTTNLLQALDSAFKRRLRFIVEFPFPGSGERREIWRRVFPPGTPTEGLDYDRLARVNLSGGNIRNIALAAAFLAAEAGHPVTMRELLTATRRELAKLNRPLAEAETRDWLG